MDLSGEQCLLLGTYDQELLCYKAKDGEADWVLAWSRSLPAPVLAIRWLDLTGDGLREVVVVTSRGVQVIQHTPHAKRSLEALNSRSSNQT